IKIIAKGCLSKADRGEKTSVHNSCCIWIGGAVVSAVASQQEGPGFNSQPGQGLSVWSLHVLLVSEWVPSGCSGFLPPPKTCMSGELGTLN
ncbi:hypothetical protein LDENG_00023450, partial [Lucifuga dentata]